MNDDGEGTYQEDYQTVIRQQKELARLEDQIRNYKKWDNFLQENNELLNMAIADQDADGGKDQHLLDEIQEELQQNLPKFKSYAMQQALNRPEDQLGCFLEIQAGAGGTESCDFVEFLCRMYQKWSTRSQIKCRIVDQSRHDIAGYKSVTLKLLGEYSYGYLRHEQGVHRFTRNSPYDSANRRHTSFASVTVSPIVQDDGIVIQDISPGDINVEVFRASGAGGQHVNKTESAVRITHLPTGIVVKSSESRSQIENRKLALEQLKSRLYQLELEQRNKDRSERFAQVRSKKIEFGSQIRTYSMAGFIGAKDTRTGVLISDINSVFDGNIDAFLDAAIVDLN
ncbi:hypothetical protein MP228_011979 [Amoeboaphelidium protococcarum]|nr:hypothetical protein MP228_011979 [Amoeboaphelidium protococcarum]